MSFNLQLSTREKMKAEFSTATSVHIFMLFLSSGFTGFIFCSQRLFEISAEPFLRNSVALDISYNFTHFIGSSSSGCFTSIFTVGLFHGLPIIWTLVTLDYSFWTVLQTSRPKACNVSVHELLIIYSIIPYRTHEDLCSHCITGKGHIHPGSLLTLFP